MYAQVVCFPSGEGGDGGGGGGGGNGVVALRHNIVKLVGVPSSMASVRFTSKEDKPANKNNPPANIR